MLFVTLISAKPTKFQHFYIPMLSSLVYIIINVTYFAASGNILYPFLNWSKPGKAVLLSLSFVFVSTPLSFFFMFGIYKLRVFVYERLIKPCMRNMRESSAEKGGEASEKFRVENGFDKNRNSTGKCSVEEV